MKIPPKVKDLIWHACIECLPTMVQLNLKHVPVLRGYPCCRVGEETVLHCLVQCPFAANCLKMISVVTHGIETSSFTGWFEKVNERVDKKSLGGIVVMC